MCFKMSNISLNSITSSRKEKDRRLILAVPAENCGPVGINGLQYSLGERDILVLTPGIEPDRDLRPEKGWKLLLSVPIETVMELPSPFDTDLISNARQRPVVEAGDKDMDALQEIYSVLLRSEDEQESPFGEEVSKSLTFALLYRLGNIYARHGNGRDLRMAGSNERISDEFFALLSRHYKVERKIRFYAAKMSVTPKYLSRAILQITGKSAKQWMDEAVILEIKNLLRTSDLTVLQISEALNFSTPSALVQYFRLHTGQTPGHYRNSGQW